jgi:hypothetical protein
MFNAKPQYERFVMRAYPKEMKVTKIEFGRHAEMTASRALRIASPTPTSNGRVNQPMYFQRPNF